MVNRQRYLEIQGGPPPLDESWWAAVLSEVETKEENSDHPSRYPAPHRENGPAHQLNQADPINWDLALELYEADQTIEMDVIGYNRGGLLVECDELQGFVPLSHLIDMPRCRTEIEQEDWLSEYVEGKLTLKVIECDQERGRVVFSERAALSEPGSRNQLLDELQTEDRVFGVVTNITDFGVFVDLGGVEGLIHVSEISWGRVRHPSDVVALGDKVEVYVISIDRERARVALSLKRLFPNPWATAQERYKTGQVIEATVTSLVPFGAFARLEEGLDGLIHISEMCSPGETIQSAAEVLYEGQKVFVRILQVDGKRQRLGLSMRMDEEV
ncbi:MAG TPA: S1 RNA-binding domain-containing protein [Anaerolineales bacterium]|nr:S1 RNA-binding domain-containing protein [Anaerolineales bacterium]